MSHFSCIGLAAETPEAFNAQVGRAFEKAAEPVHLLPESHHHCFHDESGAEIAFHLEEDGLACVTPYFTPAGGPARHRVHTRAPTKDPECVHCGGVDVDFLDADGELVTRAAVQFEYFAAWREFLSTPRTFDLELVAFADQATFCADAQAFEAAQADSWGGASAPDGKPLRFAEESFLPEGMFAPPDAPLSRRAVALFAGRVRSAVTLKNALTGRSFLHVRIATLPGVIDVVADPELVTGAPVVDQLAMVRGWLVGTPSGAPPAAG